MIARTPGPRLRRWQPAGPLLLFAFHLSGPALIAQETTPDWVPRIETLVRKGDLSGALLLLIPLYEMSRDDYTVLCWMSEVLVDSAGSAIREGADLEAESLSRRAESLAREAVRLESGRAEGWFQLGQALGLLPHWEGPRESVRIAGEVKSAFEQAISIDPGHAAALHGLARWHRSVASVPATERIASRVFFGGLPSASLEESVRLFQRAIRIEPEVIAHHLELAKSHLELGELEPALAELDLVLELPQLTHRDLGRKGEARVLMKLRLPSDGVASLGGLNRKVEATR